uniref:HPt domain-containing protein n=1 Tax=Desulfovibrio sp. U5L TaxID=596152 RepID=I2Q0C9_9BACT
MKGMYPCGARGPDAGEEPGACGEAFDPEAARRRMGVGRAAFGRLFECIWDEVTQRRTLLDEAVWAGDLKQAALHAHTIKSVAATIGAVALSRAAAAVERAAGSGDRDGLAAGMDALHSAKETLCKLVGMG